MSGVLLHLKDFDVIPKIIDTTSGRNGADPLKMLDDSTRTLWTADAAEASITYEGLGGASVSQMNLYQALRLTLDLKRLKSQPVDKALSTSLQTVARDSGSLFQRPQDTPAALGTAFRFRFLRSIQEVLLSKWRSLSLISKPHLYLVCKRNRLCFGF